MAEPPRDILTDHNYDGIQEYDNPTPGWWWAIFHGSVVFSVIYFLILHLSVYGVSPQEQWEAAKQRDEQLQFALLGALEPDAETIVRFMGDESWMPVAASLYQAHCVQCHGEDGGGLTGPNLTDDHYKNVKKIEDLADVIANGAAGGAMPPWKNQIHPNHIVLLSAYVAGLRGDNATGMYPNDPYGEEIPPWPTKPDNESTTQ